MRRPRGARNLSSREFASRPVQHFLRSGSYLIAVIILAGCASMSRKLSTPVTASDVSLGDPGRIDTQISVRSATLDPAERGEANLDEITATIMEVIGSSQSFSAVVNGDCTANYGLTPTVVKLTDLFDNVIHLRLQGTNCHSGKLVYDHQFVGWNFTQKASLRNISEVLSQEISALRAAIYTDMQRTSGPPD